MARRPASPDVRTSNSGMTFARAIRHALIRQCQPRAGGCRLLSTRCIHTGLISGLRRRKVALEAQAIELGVTIGLNRPGFVGGSAL